MCHLLPEWKDLIVNNFFMVFNILLTLLLLNKMHITLINNILLFYIFTGKNITGDES